MKRAKVFVNEVLAGEIQEIEREKKYRFIYLENYTGPSVSLEMPLTQLIYEYDIQYQNLIADRWKRFE